MAAPRMNEVAKELLRRSRDDKVPWEEARRGSYPFRDYYYRVVFPDGALNVSRTGEAGIEGSGEFRLELISDTGSIIDSLAPKPEEPLYPTLVEIFYLAESYVRDRGISKALDFLKSR